MLVLVSEPLLSRSDLEDGRDALPMDGLAPLVESSVDALKRRFCAEGGRLPDLGASGSRLDVPLDETEGPMPASDDDW